MYQYPQNRTIEKDNNRLNHGNFIANTIILGLTCYIAWINTKNYKINLKTLERNMANVENTAKMAETLQQINQKLSEKSI